VISSHPEGKSAVLGITALRRAGWIFVLLLVAAGSVAAWRWRADLDISALTAFLAQQPAAPALFLTAHIIASLLFVPRTLFAIVAGVAFGMWWGMVWATAGSVLGAVAGFLLARYVNAGLVDASSWERFGPLLARAERGGWRMVTLIRLIPIIPHSLSNYAFGLTRLRLVPYALGSLLGQLPLTLAYVDLSAAGGKALSGGTDWLVPSAIGVSALALSMLVPAIARRSGRSLSTPGV
jgi:uncharacterized membrane protein YdjX (TVP38/TMEM64 family)